MKPNQCRWCGKFTKRTQIRSLCNQCLIDEGTKDHDRGYKAGYKDGFTEALKSADDKVKNCTSKMSDLVDCANKKCKENYSQGIIKGFSVGIITVSLIAILCIWFR